MARKRKESAIELLFSMPWWVSGLLAGAAFFSPNILTFMLPVSQSGTGISIRQIFVAAAESLSPYFAGGLLIMALIIFAKDAITSWKKSSARANYDWPAPEKRPVNRQKSSQGHSRIADTLADRVWDANQGCEVPKAPPISWSLKLLQSLEWKRFEELCEALLNELSLIARNTKFGADGGIDIELYAKNNPDTLVAIAQCKAWSNPVGVAQTRAFYGVMSAKGISKGYFITTSSFTDDASEFGKADGLSLISGEKLLKLICALPAEKSEKLLKLATEGDYTTPTCPDCGLKLVPRKASRSGNRFWGCRSYPRCKGKLNMKNGGRT